MALQLAIQGTTDRAQRITWTNGGVAQALVGYTITGVIVDEDEEERAITGSLTPVADGSFDWEYSAADVETAGVFFVQFTATLDTDVAKTHMTTWEVEAAL